MFVLVILYSELTLKVSFRVFLHIIFGVDKYRDPQMIMLSNRIFDQP